MIIENVCWYCWSENIYVEAYWEYEFQWEKYNYEIIVCNEEDSWCEHSWTLVWEMPEKARELLLSDLEKELNQ